MAHANDLLAGVRRARHRSVAETIAEHLLELIGARDVDELRLPAERTLAEQMGVSRTSLREAMSALGHAGVIETRGKTKYGFPPRARVHLMTRSTARGSDVGGALTDPLEVRRMLEPEVAAKAAERASERALDEIEQWLRLMEEGVRRGERVVEYDLAFHAAIAMATGNRTLVGVIEGLTDSLTETRELSFRPRHAADVALAGHRAVLTALRRRDPAAARAAMERHLDEVEQMVRAALAQRAG